MWLMDNPFSVRIRKPNPAKIVAAPMVSLLSIGGEPSHKLGSTSMCPLQHLRIIYVLMRSCDNKALKGNLLEITSVLSLTIVS